ncbi:Transmembrane amino acid transporter protein [Tritrichomonas foetus]|uniref:Transmembrane amino acid transporter protein n=1 Tax=Tritrichomonas foetus TaxID=1144522 RepID=A0A1J4L009_9EUKA|nr:Transmembrane amino acid transporter protein [Tritrichomonas foetus]|eukprot:OHT15286.1 Transmembrane amino acid transporter protein [Tritrichomonas foetus]
MKKKPGDNPDVMFISRRGLLTVWQLVAVAANSAIGIGTLRLGSAYSTGLIPTIVINIVIALFTFYALKFYVWSAAFYHESTYEEIMSVGFSPRMAIISGACSILSTFVFLADYFSFITTHIIELMNQIDTDLPYYITNPYIIGLFLSIIFFIPVSLSNRLIFVVYISYLELLCFFIIFLYVVVNFFIRVHTYGFDPNHQFSFFRLNMGITDTISTYNYAYVICPFAWPGMRHALEPTVNNMSRMFRNVVIIAFVSYTLMGLFSYLTFFDENTGGIILDYYEKDWINFVISIICVLFILFSSPLLLNNMGYIILNVIDKTDNFPQGIWAMMGISLVAIVVVISNLSDNYWVYISYCGDIFASFTVYIFPAVFYLRAYGKSCFVHLVGAIAVIIAGLLSVGHVIYNLATN